jgi:hypothetical protein
MPVPARISLAIRAMPAWRMTYDFPAEKYAHLATEAHGKQKAIMFTSRFSSVYFRGCDIKSVPLSHGGI